MAEGQLIREGEKAAARKKISLWLIALIGLILVVRTFLYFTYEPLFFGDSASYLRLAEAIKGIGERGYDGTRVPGYPLFLALLNMEPGRIWIAQMVLGLLISLLLYWAVLKLTGDQRFGFALGALYSLIPGQFLFEAALLTETLTTFFIVASIACLVGLKFSNSLGRSMLLAVLLGISASAAGLTRPLFFPITLLFLPFVWGVTGGTRRKRIAATGLYALMPLVMQGGWLLYMWSHWHVVSPTAMAGYSMVQHAGSYFEYLPDRYAAIRDTYIQYRDAQIALRGVQTNAIWEAIPAISDASGLGFYDLSREMGRLSWLLIRDHPGLYLRDVLSGWIAFWKAPLYWQAELVHPAVARTILQVLALVGRGVSIIANFGFLILSAAVLFVPRIRHGLVRRPVVLASASMVWLISVVQTLLDHGDNPRFLVPLQMIVFFVVIIVLGNLIRSEEVVAYAE
jgi:4-amino-4-deoxy-L-arabinose transferase-like glycosyltransferase